jgi:hypothetical protein
MFYKNAKFWQDVSFTELTRSVGKWDQLFESPEQAFVEEILTEVKQIIKNLK